MVIYKLCNYYWSLYFIVQFLTLVLCLYVCVPFVSLQPSYPVVRHGVFIELSQRCIEKFKKLVSLLPFPLRIWLSIEASPGRKIPSEIMWADHRSWECIKAACTYSAARLSMNVYDMYLFLPLGIYIFPVENVETHWKRETLCKVEVFRGV